MLRSSVHTAVHKLHLTDDEKLSRYFSFWTDNEEKAQSCPAGSLLYVICMFSIIQVSWPRLCSFSPAQAPEAKWMNANTAFYLLKMSHPVTVHAAPPERAARVQISRQFESDCHSLWCVTQKKLHERLVLGKSLIQVIKTDILHLGVTSTLALAYLTGWALLKQLLLFLIY